MDLWDTDLEELVGFHDEVDSLQEFALELFERQQLSLTAVSSWTCAQWAGDNMIDFP